MYTSEVFYEDKGGRYNKNIKYAKNFIKRYMVTMGHTSSKRFSTETVEVYIENPSFNASNIGISSHMIELVNGIPINHLLKSSYDEFNTPVLYICDRCRSCQGVGDKCEKKCFYTDDPNHAVNFRDCDMRFYGKDVYFESRGDMLSDYIKGKIANLSPIVAKPNAATIEKFNRLVEEEITRTIIGKTEVVFKDDGPYVGRNPIYDYPYFKLPNSKESERTITMTLEATQQEMDELNRDYINYLKSKVDRIYINPSKKTVVVKFTDGSKQKSVCMNGDEFDAEKGVLLCFFKKYAFGQTAYGNKKRALEELMDDAWWEIDNRKEEK